MNTIKNVINIIPRVTVISAIIISWNPGNKKLSILSKKNKKIEQIKIQIEKYFKKNLPI